MDPTPWWLDNTDPLNHVFSGTATTVVDTTLAQTVGDEKVLEFSINAGQQAPNGSLSIEV